MSTVQASLWRSTPSATVVVLAALADALDRSAIAVAGTECSVRSRVCVIGPIVVQGSVDSGPTREYLDGAFGAVVRVTGPAGPVSGTPFPPGPMAQEPDRRAVVPMQR
jgi:hypothetical protein